jgi:hypothetical protein
VKSWLNLQKYSNSIRYVFLRVHNIVYTKVKDYVANHPEMYPEPDQDLDLEPDKDLNVRIKIWRIVSMLIKVYDTALNQQ